MNERFPTSTISAPVNEWGVKSGWGMDVPQRSLSPVPTGGSFDDPHSKQKYPYDPTGFYGSASPAAASFYNAAPSIPTSEQGYNNPAPFNPNLYVQPGGNYSRLAELKEKGGDKLRRVLKLGGGAIARTVSIARDLIPRRSKQSDMPSYEPAPYYQPSGFGEAPNNFYGAQQPATPSYESSWNTPYQQPGFGFNEALPPSPDSRVGGSRLRGMFDSVGNIARSSGNQLSTQFNRLPPEAQIVARGIGYGALNGVLEDYTKTKRNGKRGVKYTAVARAAVNPTGAARRAVTHGIRGARQGGMAAFADVRSQNANINTAASLASSAYDISRRFKR